jgi:hypothetical protein
MKRVARTLAAAAVLSAFPLLVAAAPGVDPHAQRELMFSYEQSQSEESPQTATGGDGSISFTGSLTTPTPCYSVSASHRPQGSRITVTVVPQQEGEICTQVITHNNYTGAVSGLSSGTYHFVVVHGTGRNAQTVYDQEVHVG